LHRRENHAIIDKYFNEIELLAESNPHIEFILPIHPNPNILKHKHLLKHVKTVNPLDHGDLITILSKCLFIITDSGGLQEEGSFLNKKIIVCRDKTERPEILGTYSILCKTPDSLSLVFNQLINDYIPVNVVNPYGDGNSAKKILDVLVKY
jgi:UDP-N-acetylglucosamine 2-epimerase (non-hydrolysing)